MMTKNMIIKMKDLHTRKYIVNKLVKEELTLDLEIRSTLLKNVPKLLMAKI